jgi:DNA repair protein RadC
MAEHDHAGHRQRLLAKLELDALEDHEYLEALLFNAIPRINTNGIAHKLLARFGSFQGVLDASVSELKSVQGIGENAARYLHLIGRIFNLTKNVQEKRVFPKIYHVQDFIEYLKKLYKDAKEEYIDCFFLDERGKIRQALRFTTGDVDSVDIATNELDKEIAIHHPYSIVLSHNHLKGRSDPSESDDDTTFKLQIMCHLQNVRLCDHFIVSPTDVYSYYATGRMKEISKEYSIPEILRKMKKKDQSIMQKFI